MNCAEYFFAQTNLGQETNLAGAAISPYNDSLVLIYDTWRKYELLL